VTGTTLQSSENRQFFARHETFHPRFGWLKKGFDRASVEPGIFLRDDAPVRLGVGKNMVRSLRYWCQAFKLLEEDSPTLFGKQLLGATGWDPYLEDPASLWLLHWKLLEPEPACYATTWSFVFNQFRSVEFSTEELFKQLGEYRDRVAPRMAESSLKKDISCLLRMYAQQTSRKNLVGEDSLDCPFAELGLLYATSNSQTYRFRMGYKPTLPSAIVIYACLQYAKRVNAQRIPIGKLLYDADSPGLVFRLTESALDSAIDEYADGKNLGMSDAAGKREFFFKGEPEALASDILNGYYQITSEVEL
jgi:hypothetical protein